MKNTIQAAAIFVIFTCTLFGQTPQSSPPSGAERDVVRISTNLVQLDVSVTDDKGNPIQDLKSDELEIYANGKKQDISNFTFVSMPDKGNISPVEWKKNEQVLQLPQRPPKPEGIRRTIALVVDDLSLSFSSTFWVKSALKKYVNENVQDGDLVAVIRTAGGIGAQQQFTTDRRQLMAAIEKIKFNFSGSGGLSAIAPITSTSVAERGNGTGNQTDQAAELENFRSSNFTNGTLGAVNFIIRGMEDLPGRKSIVLLSDGITLAGRDGRGVRQGSSVVIDSLRRLIEMANRASVVIYTIDARGLDEPGAQAADDWLAPGFAAALAARSAAFSDTQDGLRFLARETGGRAFVNSNNINYGLRQIMLDQSYYLVGYQPEDEAFDSKKYHFNKIEVKVLRPGAKVRYRSGFLGITDEQVAKSRQNDPNALVQALISPFASNDIPLRLHTLFTAGEKDQLWVKSYLHIDPAFLEFRLDPDGKRRSTFEILAMSFGDNGVAIAQFKHSFKMSIDDAAYQKGVEKGLVYEFAFPAKKPGAYQYRVALRDTGTNKVGSASQFIQVPNLGKQRLALSGIVLESMSKLEWLRVASGQTGPAPASDAERDTALRQFARGSVLRYGAEIYRSQSGAELSGQMKIFRDGKVHFEGKPTPIARTAGSASVQYVGGITLGADMPPGEYVLQLIVSETSAKNKPRSTSQFVEFEIIG